MAKYRLDSIEMPDGNEFEIPVFVAEYNVTPYEEVLAAYNAGRALVCKYGDKTYVLDFMDGGFQFTHNIQAQRLWVYVYIDEETGATVWTSGSVNSNAFPAPAVSPSNYYLTIAEADSLIRRSPIQFGSSPTKYLANDGTWQNIPTVPTKVSDLTNDSGFITTETDPTVPAWAKQNTKPSYTASEVGAIAAPSSPATGSFLVWDGLAWVAQTLSTWQGGNY